MFFYNKYMEENRVCPCALWMQYEVAQENIPLKTVPTLITWTIWFTVSDFAGNLYRNMKQRLMPSLNIKYSCEEFCIKKWTHRLVRSQYIALEWRHKLARIEYTLARDSAEGVPSRSVMRSNWCTTFFPGKSGFPVSSSANIHPTLQISIAGVYCKSQWQNINQDIT